MPGRNRGVLLEEPPAGNLHGGVCEGRLRADLISSPAPHSPSDTPHSASPCLLRSVATSDRLHERSVYGSVVGVAGIALGR